MIKVHYKLAIGLLPFVAAGIFSSNTVVPAYFEYQQQRLSLEEKRQDNEQLLSKLRARRRTEEERRNLENEIGTLRGAVPKSPELDLFMLDLEKMCASCGADLIAVESPDQETMRAIDTSEEEVRKLAGDSAGKVVGLKGSNKPGSGPAKPAAQSEDQTALKKLIRQVYVTGDYDGIISLLKKLEHYQRVTGVKQICLTLPQQGGSAQQQNEPTAERAKKLGLHQPVMSFLMTLYYLP